MRYEYDVIVVGAGHAGCEAAAVAAALGAKVLLITPDMNTIGQLSCNPAMGGIAKGQIVREIDALGGRSGIISDDCSLQFRMLNRSKGPAMWSPRAQLDRIRFIERWKRELEEQSNLDIRQDMVTEIIIQAGETVGVKCRLWGSVYAPRVILTVGTFLNGLLHFGRVKMAGGRISEPASYGITEKLADLGISTGRMKTGTPPRIVGKSIDFSLTEEQKGDDEFRSFSYLTEHRNTLRQRSCYILYTNEECHDILRESINEAPIYNGQIQSIGPRYCPSIEAKIITFRDKSRHQLFVEPEGEFSDEFYLNGFSSSLPLEVQLRALRKIPAFENVKIYRPGYAIEYDYFDPTLLYPTLQSKIIKNLFLAGQINGTTGYEEAAGQGIMAGINAVLSLDGSSNDFVLLRDEGYIGVLIDDLVTKGVDEPYRMFTSRAEYRTILRQDDADDRLTPKAMEIGTATSKRIEMFHVKTISSEALSKSICEMSIKPEEINPYLVRVCEKPISQALKIRELLLRPNVSLNGLLEQFAPLREVFFKLPYQREDLVESVEIAVKYDGYIKRERMEADRIKRLENISLVNRFNYLELDNISIESRQKLDHIKPSTIAQAARIPGVSPHDISILVMLASKPSDSYR